MHKQLLLVITSLCTYISYSQKTDTLVIFYKSDQYNISKADKQKLDSFLLRGWDRLFIGGYTDETDQEDYNLELSKKRSGTVYNYFVSRNFPPQSIGSQYFGEGMPQADNNTDEGKALNRRTEIIGYQYARIKPKPVTDPMLPVTKRLDNGFIITYRPGSLPLSMVANLEAGSGMDFQLISNTTQMRQNNFYNNTTRGEILSSMLIISFDNINLCNLDSPVLMKVPVPYWTDCSALKLKFFVSVWENGRKIWKEENQSIVIERINGINYACVWVKNFCGSVNFDFKIPECYDLDSTQVLFTNADIKKFTTELKGLNSVYVPLVINDSTLSIVYVKNKLKDAGISFALYNGKRRIRGFGDQSLSSFPYDEINKQYVLSAGSLTIDFPKVRVYDVVLKVNGERYRVMPDKNKYEFIYLKRKTDNILVDFIVEERKGRAVHYRNQPLESIRFDEATGFHVIDKKFLKELKQSIAITGKQKS